MSGSKALAKRSADSELMPPPPPPKRIKRPAIVLEEETYQAALSYIIARDYFPGWLEIDAQQDFLDAIESKNPEWIADAEKRVQDAMTPGRRRTRRATSMTPQRNFTAATDTPRSWRGATPMTARPDATPTPRPSAAASPVEQQPEVDLNLSLEQFQAKYTSEDNESFNKVLDKHNAKRREKYGWMWNSNKLPSKRQIAQAAQRQKRLEQDPTTSSTALTLHDPSRPAAIAAPPAAYDPHNNLMFPPTASHSSLAVASTAAPKSVNHPSTRLPLPNDPTAPVPPSPSLSAIDAALSGHPPPPSTTTTDSDDGAATPAVRGYAFIDDTSTSTSTPGSATLARLAAAAAQPNPFSIAEASRRETLHGKLVARQGAAARRGQDELAAGTPTPTPGAAAATPRGRREAGMTPAGRKLLGSVTGGTKGAAGGAGKGFEWGEGGKGARGWTPTPLRVRKAG